MTQPTKQPSEHSQARQGETARPDAARQEGTVFLEELDLGGLQRAVSRPGSASPAAISALARRYGNRAVQRLLAQHQPEDEELQTKPLTERGVAEGFELDDATASRIDRARGGGQPLDGALQAKMGEAMDHDFSAVRLHTDPEADQLNQQLQAKAFTTGQDVFFRQGAYDPGSGSGRDLIAHELSHVVQQGSGRVSGVGSGVTVRPAGDAFEQEADRMAHAAAIVVAPSVQRQTEEEEPLQGKPLVQRQDEEVEIRASQAQRQGEKGHGRQQTPTVHESGNRGAVGTQLVIQRVSDEHYAQAAEVAAHVEQMKARVVVVPNSAMLGKSENPAICLKSQMQVKTFQGFMADWMKDSTVSPENYQNLEIDTVLIKEEVLSRAPATKSAIIWHEIGHALKGKSEPPAYLFEVQQLIRAVDEGRLGEDAVNEVLVQREDQYKMGMTPALATMLDGWARRRTKTWPYSENQEGTG